eukprot:m.15124 g.15124  ORF g.15124 m.15124 type:complete len:71 (-) comp5289_c0_seq1:824-1036(-)
MQRDKLTARQAQERTKLHKKLERERAESIKNSEDELEKLEDRWKRIQEDHKAELDFNQAEQTSLPSIKVN